MTNAVSTIIHGMMTTPGPAATDLDGPPVAPTGVEGLDVILHGGLPRGEMHLAQGMAGTGKTTLGLQFLIEGARAGEACLYLTLSQSRRHLERIARSHGWSTAGIEIHELTPAAVADRFTARQTVLAPADVELVEVFRELAEVVERVRPRRAVVDSAAIIRLLAGSPQRYYAEVVALRQMLIARDCTALFLADYPAECEMGMPPDVDLHPLAGCVLHVIQEPRPFGDARRRLRVVKARGLPSDGGYHDMKIHRGRMEVYPRLAAYRVPDGRGHEPIASGVVGLDRLLGGGLPSGTTALFTGPSGTGKSTLAAAFAAAAAGAGGSCAVFLFDERPETYLRRCEGIGLPIRAHRDAGRIRIEQVGLGAVAPGEFAHAVRASVEARGIRLLVIDSILGYFHAMGSSEVFMPQLQELITYCGRRGVLTIMCASREGFTSIGPTQGVDVSYLSDSILVLNYFEAGGRIRRCVAAPKQAGDHDGTIRELFLDSDGVRVGGEPLDQFPHLLSPT